MKGKKVSDKNSSSIIDVHLENNETTIASNQLLRTANEEKQRNNIYKQIRNYQGRYLVLIGGSGSGKSYEVADKIIDRIVYESKETIGQAHRILCIRNERKQISESQFPLLRARAYERFPTLDWKINKASGNEKIMVNGNELIFAGLDDVNKLKSIFDITSIWIEEADQIQFKDFRELDRRLRGYDGYMQIVLSFNPTTITSWLNERFFRDRDKQTLCMCGIAPFEDFINYKCFHYDLEKLHTFIHEKTNDAIIEYYYHTFIVHSTYLDNRFIDKSYYKQMEDMKKYDTNEYNIYALGHWGIIGGTYFDAVNINKRKIFMEKYIATHGCVRGYFQYDYIDHEILDSSIEFIEDGFGSVYIYEDPKKNTPYVIGGDTAGEGKDWNVAYCTNNITGEDAATIRINIDEDLYAREVYCLGKYYGRLSQCANNALIGLEINYSTHPQKEIERLGYDNIYVREEGADSFAGTLIKRYGFITTQISRQHALDSLRQIIREEPNKVKDLTFLEEALTFVKNEKGKPVAMHSKHDDMIMARAINCAISNQQLSTMVDTYEDISLDNLPLDYQEDYENANESRKEGLLQLWIKMGIL